MSMPWERGRSPFLLNLVRGTSSEPPVNNEEFMGSFLRLGIWLRTLAAADVLDQLSKPGVPELRRFASAVAIYEQVGMLAEDVIANLVAWCAWAKNPKLLLGDLLQRVSLRRGSARRGKSHIAAVSEQLAAVAKNVTVDPQVAMEELRSQGGAEALRTLGIPWKAVPSVKAVKKGDIHKWEQLPSIANELLGMVSDEKRGILTV